MKYRDDDIFGAAVEQDLRGFRDPDIFATKAQDASPAPRNGVTFPISIGQPTAPENVSGLDSFLVGLGRAPRRLALGAEQLLRARYGEDENLQRTIRQERAVLDPKTGAGIAGDVVGSIGTMAPTAFIPGANTYTGAGVIGALSGLFQPTAESESRAANTGLGAGAGVVGQGLANLVGRVFQPVKNALTTEQTRLRQVIEGAGVQLTPAQQTGSKGLAHVGAVMESLPLTAGPQEAIKQTQREQFNQAIGRTFGANADALTEDVLKSQKGVIGQQFTDLSARNAVDAQGSHLVNQLAAIDANVSRFSTSDNARIVKNYLDEILSKVDPSGKIDGRAYRQIDSAIGKQMSSAGGDLAHALGAVRTALRDAMDQSITPADQAAWKEARRQYANLMTVTKNAERDPAGNVNPATLLTGVNANPASAELRELAKAGKAFLPSQVPNSGTAQRLFYQGLLTGGVGGAGLASDQDLGTTLGLTAASLGGPRAVQMLMNTPAGRAYLSRGLFEVPELARSAIRSVPIGLLGYSSQQ